MKNNLQLIECPRDAMQGLHEFIPTNKKVEYINQLLRVGFHTIDAGSFVSPKAIPQMKDTAEVFNQLDLSTTKSKILAIIANKRGAEDALEFDFVDYLGYPLSLSETFQQRNTRRSIETAMKDLNDIQELAIKHDKELVVYLSMGFGNPYNDPYNKDYIAEYVYELDHLQIGTISLADTIGVAEPELISWVFKSIIPLYPNIIFGAHLHSTPDTIHEKMKAAYEAGCRRFDGAIKGFGGCPMAKDDLTGNMATEAMLAYFDAHNIETGIDSRAFNEAQSLALETFPT